MKSSVAFCLYVLVFSLIACNSSNRQQNLSALEVIEHVKPRYAKGFDWKVCTDSSIQITLFDLNSPGDTLQTIRWKQRSIERLACLSTTHVSLLSALNCLDLLKGAGFADRLMDTSALRLFNNGNIINLTIGNDLDDELIYSIEPELFFVYPFGDKSYNQYLSKGIGCVQVSEYLENHPLGRAEWIRLFGCLLNKQNLADSLFERIEMQYIQLRDSIAHIEQKRPIVFAGSMDGDRWAVPSGNSYLSSLIYDAGGSYLFSDSSRSGNLVLPFETFYAAAFKADFWGKIIYEESFESSTQITDGDDRLRQLPSFSQQGVFVCNAMTTDYHGRALLEPVVLLSDLNAIFNRKTPVNGFSYFQPWSHYE